MILRTWSKGQKGMRQSCPNKGFNTYTETCKNRSTLQSYRQKYTRTHKTCPKWNQLYSDNKTDFSWFRKCLVVVIFYSFVQRIQKRRSKISNCRVRKHFLSFINIVILGISCWVIVNLNIKFCLLVHYMLKHHCQTFMILEKKTCDK